MRRLVFDAIALAVYVVVSFPALTGLAVHEWVGLGSVVVLLAHLVAHADHLARSAKSALHGSRWSARATIALDAALLVALCMTAVSGIMVSRHVLPALGLYASGYFIWKPIHSIAAEVLLALVVVHLYVHWRWIVSTARSLPFRKPTDANEGDGARDGDTE